MKLLDPTTLGPLVLKNRVVMAPMTRSRAISNVPNDLMAEYYAARAGAGLIITEGTAPSANGLGYARIPGLFNNEQVEGWRKVTQAVHRKGGRIFVQLMHTGRVSHLANMPAGSKVLAPSAIQLQGKMWTDELGQVDHTIPEEMTEEDIQQTIAEFVRSAKLAIDAGFDGVELHGANGYLLEQFLNPHSNVRTDGYGGSDKNRMRFVIEVAQAVSEAIGADRTGIRVSPYGTFNQMVPYQGVEPFYAELSRKLSALGLLYIHVIDPAASGASYVNPEVKDLIRRNFDGVYILSAGYDSKRAEHDLREDKGDLVAFGRPFIANPDLVQKFREGKELDPMDPTKLYTPGPEGYTVFAKAN